MRDPMDRSRRLTDGTRWRTFMRLLRLDDLMTSYTNARPGAGLLVVDLDLGTASGLARVTVPHLADVARSVYQLDGSRHAVSLRWAVRLRGADEREIASGGPVKAVLKR
jgi:hypothetical protein